MGDEDTRAALQHRLLACFFPDYRCLRLFTAGNPSRDRRREWILDGHTLWQLITPVCTERTTVEEVWAPGDFPVGTEHDREELS